MSDAESLVIMFCFFFRLRDLHNVTGDKGGLVLLNLGAFHAAITTAMECKVSIDMFL